MNIFYSDHFVLPLPQGHRFPMQKYSLLRQRLIQAGLSGIRALHEARPATDEEILRAHDADYLHRIINGALTPAEIRRIGFPWTAQMVERSRRSAGATIEACRSALAEGVAVNLAGGTHHAFRDHGEGYCVFNDCAIGALAMQACGLARCNPGLRRPSGQRDRVDPDGRSDGIHLFRSRGPQFSLSQGKE